MNKIKVSYYLDIRRSDKNGLYPLRLVLRKKGSVAMYSLGINLAKNQWRDGKIVNHTQKIVLNRVLLLKQSAVEAAILEQSQLRHLTGKSAKEVLDIILPYIDPEQNNHRNSFKVLFEEFGNQPKHRAGTKQLYSNTLKKIEEYCQESANELSALSFDDINVLWLMKFDEFCSRTEAVNTVGIHMRNIKAVINYAIDKGVTNNYPFRKFKIRRATTRDKSFSAEELRALFSMKNLSEIEQEAVDMFKLMFMLIGINYVDLCNLTTIERGRIEYVRLKTGKHYSIRVEPEMLEIIEKYKGNTHLLNILERKPIRKRRKNLDKSIDEPIDYKSYFNRIAKVLKRIGNNNSKGRVKKPINGPYKDICTGSARTSWGTIAQSDFHCTKEEIAAALGHHTVDVTDTYMRTAWKQKIDCLNRRMIDYVINSKENV